MRILHTADWHLGEYPGPIVAGENARRQDILRVVNHIVEYAVTQNVDLFLFAGDAWRTKRPPYADILAVAQALGTVASHGIPVVAIPGNHDIPNDGQPGAWEIIQAMHIPGVRVVTRPDLVRLPSVQVACLPSCSRSILLSKDEYKDLSPEDVNRVLRDKLSDIARGLLIQAKSDSKPVILLAHYSFMTVKYGEQLMVLAQEPTLGLDVLDGYDLACLGHIHKAQKLFLTSVPCWYCGSPERITFNEEAEAKGFYIHEMADGKVETTRIYTPARRWVTAAEELLNLEDLEAFYDELANPDLYSEAIVRVRYSAPDEIAKAVNHKRILDALNAAGAHYVAGIEAVVDRTARARDEGVTEALSVEEALARYLEQQPDVPEEEVPAIMELAKELCEGVA